MRAAAPPAPTRNAVSAWASVYGRLDKEVDKWAARLAAGQPPLSAGEQARLRSLITAVQQLQPIGNGEAQVAAAIMDGALEASRASLDASVSRLPNHVVASAVSAADEFGWRNALNKPAVAAIVNGGVGQMTSDWARLNGELQDRIRLELAQGVALGENPKKVAKRLHKTLDGAMSMGQARSVVISRTVMAAAYDQATLDVYRQAAQEGLVIAWEWLTAEDDRVCVVCSELNGTLHRFDTPTYKHPSCRCTMIAVDPETAFKHRNWDDFPYQGSSRIELHTNEAGWTSWRKKKTKTAEERRGTWRAAEPGDARREVIQKDMDDLLAPFLEELGFRGWRSSTELKASSASEQAQMRETGVAFGAPQDVVTYKVRIADDYGNVLFKIERTFDPSTNTVKHDYFQLAPELQGRGTATRVNNALYEEYRAQGFEAVELFANVDVGGYTWARAGYGWKDLDTAKAYFGRLHEDWGDFTGLPGVNVPDEFFVLYDRAMAATTLDEVPLPIEIANLGRDTPDHWGKTVMLGSAWQGRRLL